MSVTSQNNVSAYLSNGSQTTYTFPYPIINPGDILIQTLDVFTHVVTTLVLNTHYTIPTAANQFGEYPSGISIIFTGGNVPALGQIILISRMTARTQLVQLIDNAPFVASTINNALDKLTLITQDLLPQFKGSALGSPTLHVPYLVGDWFKNGYPQPGGYFGWGCVAAGSPGVWKTFGAITA